VRVDQSGDDRGAAAVDDHVRAGAIDGADGGDAPVHHEDVGSARDITEDPGDEGVDVDERKTAQRRRSVGLRGLLP
jgi:hypothetical protein